MFFEMGRVVGVIGVGSERRGTRREGAGMSCGCGTVSSRHSRRVFACLSVCAFTAAPLFEALSVTGATATGSSTPRFLTADSGKRLASDGTRSTPRRLVNVPR